MTTNRRPTVLVVDDEIDTCQNLADILSDLDYAVDTASNGDEAMALIQTRTYDLAILDLKMPGMDGVSLYRQVRKLCPQTVAIIVTAYASDPTTSQALDAGAWQVLSKPVDLASLLPMLDEAIRQPLVLVVDDDESLCDNLWELLRERRLRVAIAHSEQCAIETLKGRRCDLVLVDLKLPGGDGRNVISTLHQVSPASRTVIITGHPDEFDDVIAAAGSSGADAVCLKPFNVSELLHTIEQLAPPVSSRSHP